MYGRRPRCKGRIGHLSETFWSRQREPAGTATGAQGHLSASGPAAGEKGLDDALFLGFYLVRAVELIVAARGFSRCY